MIFEYIWWTVIIIAALAASYLAVTIKRRRSARLLTTAGTTVERLDEPTSKTAVKGKHLKYANVSIKCPQLQLLHADIWGTNEELETVCQLFDENDQPIAGRAIRVSVEGSEIGEFTTDNQGICNPAHAFNNKGSYSISYSFGGDEVYPSCSHQMTIRVVDYREEAVGLFNAIKKSAMSKGAIITGRSTPREVEATLLNTFAGIDSEKLDRFIGYVEESLYSSHYFKRNHYADMLSNYLENGNFASPSFS